MSARKKRTAKRSSRRLQQNRQPPAPADPDALFAYEAVHELVEARLTAMVRYSDLLGELAADLIEHLNSYDDRNQMLERLATLLGHLVNASTLHATTYLSWAAELQDVPPRTLLTDHDRILRASGRYS